MAQFDVFENPSVAQRGGFPYVVVLQSDHLSAPLPSRLLRKAVASLKHDGQSLIDALDAVLAGV